MNHYASEVNTLWNRHVKHSQPHRFHVKNPRGSRGSLRMRWGSVRRRWSWTRHRGLGWLRWWRSPPPAAALQTQRIQLPGRRWCTSGCRYCGDNTDPRCQGPMCVYTLRWVLFVHSEWNSSLISMCNWHKQVWCNKWGLRVQFSSYEELEPNADVSDLGD